MKAHSAQFIDILFPLVISTVQGTHAVVATFLQAIKYSTIKKHAQNTPPTQCNNYTLPKNWAIHVK